ncbi:hypothetical protein BS47DRAFT_1361569 [Hydnum rufescens UP504]|uniref:Uncharacterized protein n=1 Tax=Hydnum rufescens UP504 TaxID=1448309 RepID=A0A9P6AZ64_9AGAM|nr:hypothetical protein BS47DRAFT_1361569 [Hydnum rufescens UP504]
MTARTKTTNETTNARTNENREHPLNGLPKWSPGPRLGHTSHTPAAAGRSFRLHVADSGWLYGSGFRSTHTDVDHTKDIWFFRKDHGKCYGVWVQNMVWEVAECEKFSWAPVNRTYPPSQGKLTHTKVVG